jgi:molybdopterin-containing oxidoreductase family iron-sulfur binding subunit
MEKCTFCVQRIASAKQRASVESRPLADGDVTPACAQACPAGAIVFGDLNAPDSRAARLSRSPRGTKLLDELGTMPKVTYLSRQTEV